MLFVLTVIALGPLLKLKMMNKDNKIIVCIGDVHGSIFELNELLNKIQYNKDQMRLIMAGDLVDRGPDSVGVVRKIRELNVECVKGNHEDKHIRFHNNQLREKSDKKFKNEKYLNKFEAHINASFSSADWNWLENLPIRINIINNYWVIHGGLIPSVPFDKQEDSKMMRARFVDEHGNHKPLKKGASTEGAFVWSEKWKGPESVIYGHSVQENHVPRIDKFDGGECIGIDTGCCFGGKLTALIWDTQINKKQFVSVNAKEEYVKYEDRT